MPVSLDKYARQNAWKARNRERYLAQQREAARARRLRDPDKTREQEREKHRLARERHPDKHRSKSLAYWASKFTATVEPVDRIEVLRRGEGVCGICRTPVDPDNFHVDHIVPLARGGEHSYANTQPAHPRCNTSKGASLIKEIA